MFKVYGAKGCGNVVVEAALTLMGLPYETVDADPWGDSAARDTLERVSPMKQVPVLEWDNGRRMSESAAILLWFSDSREGRPFAPTLKDDWRPDYLRWMVFIPAAIYPMYTLKDNAPFWTDGEAAQLTLTARAVDRVLECWSVMEAEVEPRPFIFGEQMTLLDLYVAVVSRWTPGRKAFVSACPKLGAMVGRIDADPRLQALWAERFPFTSTA
jgi:GST-like protein